MNDRERIAARMRVYRVQVMTPGEWTLYPSDSAIAEVESMIRDAAERAWLAAWARRARFGGSRMVATEVLPRDFALVVASPGLGPSEAGDAPTLKPIA